jgi:hypothetical protein
MFSKILVGLTAVVLLGVGGFIYWDHHNCPSRQGCGNGSTCPNAVMPCCQMPEEISTSTSTELLTVMPREVAE